MKKIGFLATSLVLLAASSSVAQSSVAENLQQPHEQEIAKLTPDAVVAQRSEDADRLNYFGIGGTLGVSDDGDTELGDGGFSLMGRFSLNEKLAIHSASVLSGDSFASFALTTSFAEVGAPETIAVIPFVGAGIGLEVDDFEISPLITTGVDIPFTDWVTGTARVNAAFNDGTDIGVVLGVGVDALNLF